MDFASLEKSIEEYTYLIFVVILIASIVVIYFFVPETKNRSFDDIATSLGRVKKKQPFHEDGEEMKPMEKQDNDVRRNTATGILRGII